MNFAVVGINFESNPLSILEKAVFSDTQKMEMYVLLQEHGIQESVILSTCNRSEIYFLYQDEIQIETVKSLFGNYFRLTDQVNYTIKTQNEALIYLYEVSNGLHSLVLGEDQIAGQVVKSEEFARINGQSKKIMNHLFRDVISCTKKAKTQFKISEHPLSLSYVAIQYLKNTCGIENKTALILGSGKMSSLALKYLIEHHIQHVILANRSETKAHALMQENMNQCEFSIIPFKDRYQVISECDIVISATSSNHVILEYEKMPKIDHDIYMIDMASPRDIDLKIHQINHVHVEDMETLQNTIQKNNQIRQEKVSDIKQLIQEESNKTLHWMNNVKVDETIRTLKQRIDQVSEDAYEIITRKIDLNSHDQYIIKKTLKTSMQRLMQQAIITLKNEEDEHKLEEYEKVVQDLFL